MKFLRLIGDTLHACLFSYLHRAGLVLMCADAPDMSGSNQAALLSAQLSKEQLDWAKQIYAETAPERSAATARAAEISDAQLASMKLSDQIASETHAYQMGTFRPLEEAIVADAQAYDTPERRAAEVAKATAGVEAALSAQRQATVMDNMRRGVNPSSMKMQALNGVMDINASKAKAGAASLAADKVEQLGYARKMDAASLGRNLATDRVNATNAALTAGNSSNANSQSQGAITAQGNAILQQGYGTAIGGLNGTANVLGNNAQTVAGVNAGNSAATGAAVGTIAVVI